MRENAGKMRDRITPNADTFCAVAPFRPKVEFITIDILLRVVEILLRVIETLLQMVDVFMINGRDFHEERSRFFMLNAQDFHDERSRFSC